MQQCVWSVTSDEYHITSNNLIQSHCMELWLLSISMWPIPYRSVFGSWNTVVASYALINKVLLKFHADLLRFLFLFHGLFIFYFIFMIFCHSLLFECCMEVNSPGQQDHPGWGWCALKNAWKTSSKNIYIYIWELWILFFCEQQPEYKSTELVFSWSFTESLFLASSGGGEAIY